VRPLLSLGVGAFLRLLFAQGSQSARKICVDDRPHAARLRRALSSKKSRAQANAHGLRRRSDAAGRHHCGAGADLAHQLLELGDKKEAPGCHRPARCAYAASAIFISASGLTNLSYGWQKGDTLGTSMVWAGVAGTVAIGWH
jgi:hypothetical protein